MDVIGISSVFTPGTASPRLNPGPRRAGRKIFMSSPLTTEERVSRSGVTGDSFIRDHLRMLAPYQPILPFEVAKTVGYFFFRVHLSSFNRYESFMHSFHFRT